MKKTRKPNQHIVLLLVALALATPMFAQNQSGILRGTVLDPQAAAVENATVTATNENTNVSASTTTSSAGVYIFPSLVIGPYSLRVEVSGFAPYQRRGVNVQGAQVTEATVNLELATGSSTVMVEAGANVVQTESSQVTGTFEGRALSDIPIQSGAFLSVLNLVAFLPNTTTQLGGTSGNGGSVGGLRGRQNNFSIDGTSNNDPSTNASTQQVIPDAVQELVVNQNIYSAEYGRGSGGQFNVITKTGTNQLHFGTWLYNSNRAYNAADNQEKEKGSKGRFDFNRVGGDIGGPILKDRLFFYGAYEFNNLGGEASARGLAPTATGLANLNTLARNQQVRDILAQFPTAPVRTSFVNVNGNTPGICTAGTCAIDVGTVIAAAPNFTNTQDYIINGDYSFGQQSMHGRYLKDRTRQPSFGSSFPQTQFASFAAQDSRRVILNHVWTATSHLVNDFRGTFVKYSQFFPLSGVARNFPTLVVDDLSSITIGPNGNLPQHRVFDQYSLGDAVTLNHGRHTLKGGGEYYWYISPSDFLQNSRGQYGYRRLNELVNDLFPSKPGFTLQGLGSGFFSGNSKNFDLYFQDDIKVSSRLTLNLGIRYDFFGNPAGAAANALNEVASLPDSPLVFRVPKQDWNNFGPRFGFAWDPTGTGKWAVRGGGGVSYDVIPWNFFTNANPVQRQVVLTSRGQACAGTFGPPPAWCADPNFQNFLASGAMRLNFSPPTTQAAARAQTSQIMADAKAAKVFSWSLGVQHEIFRNTSLEVRYLGTRALELPVQLQLNSISPFERGARPLPTFFSGSDIPATMPTSAPTLSDFTARQGRRFAAQGFTGGAITIESPVGSSTYHGGAVELLHRMSHGLQLRANYTLAKTMDNATNDLNTSAVNPRRPADSYNLRNEWARSALDVRHKVALTWLYDLPGVQSDYRIFKAVTNGWQWTGSYLFQSGQPVTIQSGVDSNGNGDAAGDRAILNSRGREGTGSLVDPVCRNAATGTTSIAGRDCVNTSGNLIPSAVVGYVAQNPNARYIQAGVGALSNLGRNTFNSPYFNVWNMAVLKNNHLTERVNLQFRVQAFDVFNHRNFTLGNLSAFNSTANGLVSTPYANINSIDPNDPSASFLNPKLFNGGSRNVEFGMKLTF